MGEKTEKATQKKLRDARDKGQVAKSQDLPSAFTFVASIWITLAMGSYLYGYIGSYLVTNFNMVKIPDPIMLLSARWAEAIYIILMASLPILVAVSVIGVIVNFLVVGPVFTTEVFKFDIKKFNPVDNLKQKFKLKTLVELLKSCLKIGVAAYLIYGVVYNSLPVLIHAVNLSIYDSLMIFNNFLMEVIFKVGLFFLVIAVLDFAYQKYNFGKEMMMEKFEVKQEYKNTEGDPQIKGKRRQIAQEMAYSEGPTGGVKRAAAVVTNPTHLAIAIGYEKDVDAAPYVVAMGSDILAERIIKIATESDIPIIRNIKLAHKLWEEGEVHEFIPESSYEAVAQILRWIASLQSDTPIDYDPDQTEFVEN
jgi:type III secretion protein U